MPYNSDHTPSLGTKKETEDVKMEPEVHAAKDGEPKLPISKTGESIDDERETTPKGRSTNHNCKQGEPNLTEEIGKVGKKLNTETNVDKGVK